MNAAIPVVTVDGPSGVGKGTICLRVAANTGWHLLDSGSLYRLTALKALQSKLDDERQLAELAAGLNVHYLASGEQCRIELDGIDVSEAIREEQVGVKASKIAVMPAVRSALMQRQRDFARPPGLVADGRDMGTVVFPNAGLKIFLTASAGERAKRRYKQLIEKGIGANLPDLAAELEKRDERDSQRAVAPLAAADDAITIDTTHLTIDEVTDEVMKHVRSRYQAV